MIDPTKISEIIRTCLFTDEELPLIKADQEQWARDNGIIVNGLVRNFAFHKSRIEQNRKAIIEMISELPKEFDEGWSFLNMCLDARGEQWGDQSNAEELACLGMAIGVFVCLAPREMWSVLPGGVPYYQRKVES